MVISSTFSLRKLEAPTCELHRDGSLRNEIMASKEYSESEKEKLVGENNRLLKQLSREFLQENVRP
jgi:hypothetical protein